MRFIELRKKVKGKMVSARIGVPDNLMEACQVLGEPQVYLYFYEAYLAHQSRIMTGLERQRVTVDLSKLSPLQRVLLSQILEQPAALPAPASQPNQPVGKQNQERQEQREPMRDAPLAPEKRHPADDESLHAAQEQAEEEELRRLGLHPGYPPPEDGAPFPDDVP